MDGKPAAEPPERAEVVIVGGGVMGASVAYHLAELGVEDVVLVEREALASGSTSKAAGGIRAQFADELNVRIALRSIAEFERLESAVGIAYKRPGYLFLLDREDDVDRFREAVALQQALGVPSRMLEPAEAKELVPALETSDLLAATYCPLDGHAAPEAVVQAYARAAAAKGVRILQGTTVEGVAVRAGKVEAVETPAGAIRTGTVVCAAGVWSREVGALAGVDLPVVGETRWIHFSPEDGGLPDELPFTIDFSTGFYFHREGRGLAFGGREPTLEELATSATRRLPLLADLPVQASWGGLYEMSPDRNAVVGEASEPRRFLYATGFSGHGFQQAPAVGEHLAELVAGRAPSLDLAPFALDRFGVVGAERRERFVV